MSALPLLDGDSAAPAGPVVLELPALVSGECLRALRGQLLAGLRHPSGLVIDCHQVQDVSPAAQALLVAVHRAARQRGVTWHLVGPTAALHTALRRSGLSHLLVPRPGRPTTPTAPHGWPASQSQA